MRLCMIPLIIWLYCTQKNYALTAVVLVLSGLTDMVDGYIARRFNMVTDLGKALDPVADKLTQASVMFCLLSRFRMEKLASNKVLNVLSKPVMNFDKICATASPSPNRWSDKVPSKERTKKDIEQFIKAFAKSAKLLKDNGVDGVEVHAVHEGYRLDQFTLKYVNKRTDEYVHMFAIHFLMRFLTVFRKMTMKFLI